MSHQKGAYLGGVRDVESLRLRCWCDPDTKCWHFRTAHGKSIPHDGVRQVVWVHDRGVITVTRAAWEFSNRQTLPLGMVAFRICKSHDCANPRHIRAGTRAEHGLFVKASGALKGQAKRIIACRANGLKRSKLTAELRQWAIQSRQTGTEIAHGLDCSESLVYNTRRRARTRLVMQSASIFDLGRAIGETFDKWAA